jgi:hypothetical protein
MKYKLTKRDHYRAYLLHIKPRKAYEIIGILMICLAMLVGILCIFLLGDTQDVKLGIIILIGIPLVLSLIYITPLYSLNKSYKQTKDIGSEIDLSVKEDSFLVSTQYCSAAVPYRSIFKIKSNKNYLLVYVNQYVFRIIPKQNSDLIAAAKTIEERFMSINKLSNQSSDSNIRSSSLEQ